jgi:hypothetical protein
MPISTTAPPISTTAPIDAKTHVWPIDGIAQWLTNQRSLLGHIQAKTRDVFWLAAGYTMIDQSAIAIGPYPGKNTRHFLIGTPLKTNILLKCSLTLTILIIIWISIILLFQFIWDFIYSPITGIHMCHKAHLGVACAQCTPRVLCESGLRIAGVVFFQSNFSNQIKQIKPISINSSSKVNTFLGRVVAFLGRVVDWHVNCHPALAEPWHNKQ